MLEIFCFSTTGSPFSEDFWVAQAARVNRAAAASASGRMGAFLVRPLSTKGHRARLYTSEPGRRAGVSSSMMENALVRSGRLAPHAGRRSGVLIRALWGDRRLASE